MKVIKLKTYNKHKTTNQNFKFCKLIISTNKISHIIDIDNIEHIMSNGCYTVFCLADNTKIISSRPLAHYEKILNDYYFLRVHNKYIVNINHIIELISGKPIKVKLRSGNIIPVTKLKKFNLKNYFIY